MYAILSECNKESNKVKWVNISITIVNTKTFCLEGKQ